MKYLLDTHVLLWYINGNSRLSSGHTQIIEDPANTIVISYVSLWEMTIKISLDKLQITGSIEELIAVLHDSDISFISIDAPDLAALAGLPFLHRDPFDRLLIAQSHARNMILLSEDQHIKSYHDIISVL